MKTHPRGNRVKERTESRRKLIVILTACAFVLIGVIMLQRSQADTFILTHEAEEGISTGGARTVTLLEADGVTSVTAVAFDIPGTSPEPPPPPPPPPSGPGTGPDDSGALKHKKSGRCLDNDAAKTTVGNKIQLYDCFMSTAQKWTFKPIDGKEYSLLQVQGMCIHETGPVNNADVRLADCDSSSDNQQWKWRDSEYIVNASNDRCLVPAFGGTANAANVVVANCDNSESQRWDMMDQDDAIPDPPPPPENKSGIIKHSSGRCLDNSQSRLVEGNILQLWDCNGTGAQKYTLWMLKIPDHFELKIQDQPFCLESYVVSSGNPDTLKVRLHKCDGRFLQKWRKGTNGSLVNYETKRCLVPKNGGTGNGTEIVVANCNGSASQKWSTP